MPSLDILPQLVINGLIAGSIYALAASGFSLVHYVVKFMNFAQGAVITISAYMFYLFFSMLRMNFFISGVLAILASIAIMMLMNILGYRQLRERKSTKVVIMISSLALLIFFSSLILAIFGSSTKTISLRNFNKTFDFGFFTITLLQAIIIFSSILLFLLLLFMLKKTRLGKSMRALADNKEVSQIIGINPEKIYNYTFIIAGIAHMIFSVVRADVEPWYVSFLTSLIIDVPAFLIGILFLIGWFKNKKIT